MGYMYSYPIENPLITTHEPPSRVLRVVGFWGFGLSGFPALGLQGFFFGVGGSSNIRFKVKGFCVLWLSAQDKASE